jgi:hypothetical protein
MPTRGFTAVVSVFGGTPPPKPLKCKIRFAPSGDGMGHSWAHHTGDDLVFVFAKFSLPPDDITRMSRCAYSQTNSPFVAVVHRSVPQGKTKNPAYTR